MVSRIPLPEALGGIGKRCGHCRVNIKMRIKKVIIGRRYHTKLVRYKLSLVCAYLRLVWTDLSIVCTNLILIRFVLFRNNLSNVSATTASE